MNKCYINQFKDFLEKELQPATSELDKFENEDSRKHIQKLVFTNLVDRLDYCIDNTLLDILETDDEFMESILEKHKQPASESETLKIILSDNPKDAAISRLKDTVRNTILRERHSQKIRKLLLILVISENEMKRARVNPAKGMILKSFKKQNDTIPTSVIGYCDWLYSRRNAIVHGGGRCKLLDNDLKQLKKQFKVEAAKTAKISLSSVRNTSAFYSELLAKFLLK